MYSIIYLSLSVIVIVFVFYLIYSIRLKEKRRKDKELIRLNFKVNINMNILFAASFLILGILVVYLLYGAISKSYIPFKGKYIDSFFQIFDDAYIDSLREYFLNNNMVGQLLVTVQYLMDIPQHVFLAVFMISFSIYYFYVGFKQNIIYEDGIFVNSTLYKWDGILGFDWGELHEKENKAYYDLTVNLPKLYDLNVDKKLRVNAEDRDKIDEILVANIIKSGM
ncbi:hypothetical protein HZF24_02375 [Sedimentibacter hydroxybenzoicus DSM 7310]|uniref:DUF5673 domain-containing protein n=1 Tax=Sedimentibacter hydroxybenzoicus DSM 7310 TaxID=1123245 RepID=A0A974GV41_SEDHY|nr:hypothetical protein [Sedimentibacter hydroxybenzoicus]NYB72983.1 hypothetical protein [Sedimentibacter hydroxybenzoicus DSM 7310]